ncbi:MAG: aminoglycoside 6-N-acetyltransferase [Thermoleophilaceae bacterium]|jgi:aminoglycoside 6'-N-acetyltransferase|nr:aminoglycoside 6-N-acetyltransferase [Thermoleophilaceae bacterium]
MDVALRPVGDEDWPVVAAILREPSVARWWGVTREDIREDFEDPHAILVDGELAGVVDIWEEPEPGYRHGGLDIVLSEPFQDRGIGREALRVAARMLFEERGHHRITIDPAVENARAIRCYEAIGFKPVGVMRNYEQAADGTWHDGLLMDLLRDELR